MLQAKVKNLARTDTDRVRPLPVAFAACVLLLLLAVASAQAQSVRLESGWKFLADKEGTLKAGEVGNAQGWREARVGLSWNAQFEDLRDYMGVAWYRTRFDVEELKNGRRAVLTFGAVDYFSEVFVNNQKVGEHEGGYTPFSFDVTQTVKPGANELLVRVVDPPMDEGVNRARFPPMMYNEIPHGKQNWYVQTGGIWQPVSLEIRPRVYLERVRVTPQIGGSFTVEIDFGGVDKSQEPLYGLSLVVRDHEKRVVFSRNRLTDTEATRSISGKVDSPQLWSPDNPALYTLEVSLHNIGALSGNAVLTERDSPQGFTSGALEKKTVSFGFRSFEARDGKFFLNTEPYYMIAALDQDFYPETIYTTPSEEYVRDMMIKAKRLGLNMLRCHIKVCEPVYLKVADEVGVLVWYEIPSWNDFNHFSAKAAERGERVFREMTERDWNHPSIVVQSIINESWGADLKQPEQRRWLLEAFDRAKKLVAPRGILVVDNSACCDNFHLKTDINDFHQYFSQPDNHDRWDKWVADFATRPKWTFSQHGDAQTTGREPLVVSEFGNWGLPKLPKDLPWWFARDFGGREVTRPQGVHERFREFHLSTLFRDYDELAEATQWHQFRSLKHEIEEIRRHASIQGYVITEFTDINWEANGLMDMWRNPKAYAEELAKIQQPNVMLARLPKRNFTSAERVEIPIMLSRYGEQHGGQDLNALRISWTAGSEGKGSFTATLKMGRGVVEPLGSISLNLPVVDRPQRVQLSLRAINVAGRRVAENSYDLFVYPQPTSKKDAALFFHGQPKGEVEKLNALKAALADAGYRVIVDAKSSSSATLLVSTSIDSEVERHLRGGGRAIILANSKEAFPAGAPYKVVPREGDLDGNWVTNFNWVRTNQEPFSAVALNPILGFEGVHTVPRFVIENVPGEAYRDVLAGIFYGWINNNRALAVQMRAGEGKMLATTFRFDAYGRDAYATHLLDAMIRYVASQNFAPKLDWNATVK